GHGAAVIEDAAQAAGGALHGAPLGALASLAVLSFGRGKGTAAGGGGALIAREERWRAAIAEARELLAPASRGSATCVRLVAQWALGRPPLYRIPSSVPALRLGETVYHAASEPRAISGCSLGALSAALECGASDVESRRRLAERYAAAIAQRPDASLRTGAPIPGSAPGYLRFPVLAADGRGAAPDLGILRGYPRMLTEWPQSESIAIDRGEALSGSRELARTLFTLPTHYFVRDRDVVQITDWLAASPARG
ncbi:MAG: DegT/DnrJ/EryC1/StrS family aminotransferase, partial [Gemmatimonadota bacterium]|nr:DegT/DnrJ/EryC1/StrS family aminotransferase [Gemmatimonadota bacterium]